SSVVHTYQPYLHCEFEGGGIYKFLQALYVLLPVATAAAIICSIPVIGWAVCAILGAVALVIAIAGVVAALNDTGSPSGVGPPAHTSAVLRRGSDILFVSGTWVYDSGHEGWNEIHPMKKCLRLATVRYI